MVDTGRAGQDGRERTWIALSLIAGVGVALRVAGMATALPDHDSVNFALGLEHFDLAAHRPHFPGYPVFLALAWPLRALGLGPATALSLPATALSALTILAVGAALLRFGRAAALLGAASVATLPGLVVADGAPLSDGLGAQLVALAAAALLVGAPNAGAGATTGDTTAPQPPGTAGGRLAAIALGLLPGVRASSAIITLAGAALLLATGPHRERAVRATLLVAAVAAWLVPLTLLAGGPAALVEVGARFTAGHFTTWGGAAGSTGAPEGLSRAALLARNLTLVAVGPGATVLLGLLAATARPGRRWTLTLVALALPYAAWAALAQNPEKPRHLLPLLPLLVLAAAPAAARISRAQRPALALVPAVLLLTTLPRLPEASLPSPAAQAGLWLARTLPAEQLQVYAGVETAVLRTYTPAHRSVLVRDAAALRAAVAQGTPARRILVTSGVDGLDTLPGQLAPLARFQRSPLIDPVAPSLTVWEWFPPPTKPPTRAPAPAPIRTASLEVAR